MNKSCARVTVAAYGWSHPGWCGNFYPDDLPEDWQLSYYSNEFRAVVVPVSAWVGVDMSSIEAWLDDVSQDFVFYLEVADATHDGAKLAGVFALFGEQLGGILLHPIEADADLTMVSASLEAALSVAPVCLLLPKNTELSEVGLSLLEERGVSLAWTAGQGLPGWSRKGFAVARVASAVSYTPRQWRELVENCLHCEVLGGGEREVLLMLEQPALDPEALRVVTMISDMLVAPNIETREQAE